MLWRMTLKAVFFVSTASAPLEVQYGDRNDCPPCPDMLRILTTVPLMPSRIMILSAPCVRKKGARTLTAKIWSNSSGEVSRMVPRSVMAAQLTRVSMRPKWLSAAATT